MTEPNVKGAPMGAQQPTPQSFAATAVLQALRASWAQLTQGAQPPHRCIVAVSGGPDSQALLDAVGRLAAEMQLQAQAVGIDHGLRAAARDELRLAEALAKAHGLPYRTVQVVLPRTGNQLARARAARYRALRAAAAAFGASSILVAHTANDQAETVLFHLARGAGLRGAAGMAPSRKLIRRPLLGISRAQVLEHLQQHHIPHAFDPSNANGALSRIALRTRVLPALEAINPNAVAHLQAFAQVARAEDGLLDRLARRLLGRCLRPNHALCAYTLGRAPRALWPRVLRLWLRPLGCRPDGRALARLMAALACPHAPLAQGAMAGCTVHLRRGFLQATRTAGLPPRRAGSR